MISTRKLVGGNTRACLLRYLFLSVGLRWGGAEGNMTAVNFTKKTKPLTGGGAFFVPTPLCESQPTDQKEKSV